MIALDPIQLSLILLAGGALVMYLGLRLLWAAVPSIGLWRGVVVGLPLIVLALVQATWAPGAAVALLVAAAVLVLTLGLGVSTIDLPAGQSGASPVLRCLLPLAATACLAGFHGELTWLISAGLLAVGVLTLWTADDLRQHARVPAKWLFAVPAVLLFPFGMWLLLGAADVFRHASGSAASTPVVVLLIAPACLLALLGLLTAEARNHTPETPHETAAGLAIVCLGIGVPLVALLGRAWPMAVHALSDRVPKLASLAATQPADVPHVAMPLATWRVDTVLLVVVSVILLPVGTGRFRLGKIEGVALILLYLAYAAVATRTGALAG